MRTAAFNMALLLDRFALVTPPCLYGLGALVLLGKVWRPPEWAGAAALAALTAAVWTAALFCHFREKRFSREDALTWLDWRNEAGGRIMAGDAEARARVVPALSFRPLLRRLPVPVVFLLAAAATPPVPDASRGGDARIEPALGRLLNEVDASAEAGALAETKAEELRRQINRIRRLAGEHPEAAAETLSIMPDRLDAARAERLDAAATALEKAMAAREGEGEGEGEAGNRMEPLRQALDNLARAEGGWEKLPEAMRGGATGESLERLLGALEHHAETLGDAIEAARGQSEQGAAEQAAAERLTSVSEMLREMRFAEALAGSAAGREGEGMKREGPGDSSAGAEPGRGGISRGPGEAPLWFGAPSAADLGVEYLPLPRSGGDGRDVLLRRERTRPDEMPKETGRDSWRSAVDAPEAVRGGVAAEGLGPERERAVARYFERITGT
ncbi:MAG: hypothetical protein LBS30_01720 [Planctomycetota bacterium]|jgi:hypothetical protein|nr:hypothetical protein [Planctomycetota bacterium]